MVPILHGIRVGRGPAAIFVRAVDIGGLQAGGARRGKVAVMRGDEAEFAGIDAEKTRGGEVGFGSGL